VPVTHEIGSTHPGRRTLQAERTPVIKWAIIFFAISVIAGIFGFTGIASGARSIAKALFFIALILFLIVLILGVFMGVLVF